MHNEAEFYADDGLGYLVCAENPTLKQMDVRKNARRESRATYWKKKSDQQYLN